MTSTFPRAVLATASLLTATAAAIAVAGAPDPADVRAVTQPVSSPAAAVQAATAEAAAGSGRPAAGDAREPASATRSQHRTPLRPAAARAGRDGAAARHADGRHGSRHRSGRHHAKPATTRHAPAEVRKQTRRVLAVARAQRGKPYVWGAAGPRAFDCSGYVQWVYRHALGRHLPKYTDTQWAVLEHISRRQLRPGDLVFVGGGRHKSHVGIYAGHWRWWVAPHTGSHVKNQRIWPAKHTFARVVRRSR